MGDRQRGRGRARLGRRARIAIGHEPDVSPQARAAGALGCHGVERPHEPSAVVRLEQHNRFVFADRLAGLVADVADVHVELIRERALKPQDRRRPPAAADPCRATVRCDHGCEQIQRGRPLLADLDKGARRVDAVAGGRHE
jgi:hypothetical protein